MAAKVYNFSCLTINNIYKVTNVDFFKTDYNLKQVIYTLESGLRLYGRSGINEKFAAFSTPFYFRYKGQTDNALFKKYKFDTFKDSDELLAQNHDEILEILINYVTDKVCEGCARNQPDEPPMTHSCLLETRIEQAKQYLTVALNEHPKYEVGDIVDAFVIYREKILGRALVKLLTN